MEKIWYTNIQGYVEGPWSITDLKCNHRITPDTLVRKEGSTKWIPMRAVPELKEVFIDEKPEKDHHVTYPKPSNASYPNGQIILEARKGPPPYLFWLLTAIIILAYIYIYTHLKMVNE